MLRWVYVVGCIVGSVFASKCPSINPAALLQSNVIQSALASLRRDAAWCQYIPRGTNCTIMQDVEAFAAWTRTFHGMTPNAPSSNSTLLAQQLELRLEADLGPRARQQHHAALGAFGERSRGWAASARRSENSKLSSPTTSTLGTAVNRAT